MKLCHIVPSLEEKHGGPSRSVRALCAALAKHGHSVELLTTAVDAPRGGLSIEVSARFHIRTFRRCWPRRICRCPGLAQAIQESAADIVHHHALWLRTLGYAAQHSKRRRVPLVISPRGMMSTWAWGHHGWRKTLARTFIHPRALECATAWHATSLEERDDIRARGFDQFVCISPNGVSTPSATARADARAVWSQLCPELVPDRTALFYGRFHQKKRVIELIDSWLENAPAAWTLLMVGVPEQYTPAELEAYVARAGAAGRVRAFDGSGRPAPYSIASLFLLPSHSENFGLVIAESMANGIPVLVTDTTPWHEVNDRKCGWCVPWSEFGKALRNATSLPASELQMMGEAAEKFVGDHYTWDNTVRSLEECYAKIARDGCAGSVPR